MIRHILVGFLIGVGLDIIWWTFGEFIQDTSGLKFICFISTPVAIVFSKISGWPLHQESAIMVYIFSILITLPLLGIIGGLIIGLVKRHKKLRIDKLR